MKWNFFILAFLILIYMGFPAIGVMVVNLAIDLFGCQEPYNNSPSSFSLILECGNNKALADRLENLLMTSTFLLLLTIPSGMFGLVFLITAQIMSLSIRRYRD